MLLSKLRQTIFYRNCLSCQRKLDLDQWFCDYCWHSLPLIERACPTCSATINHQGVCGCCLSRCYYFDNMIVPFIYREPINRLIYQFKYRHQFYAYQPLTKVLLNLIKQSQQPLPELIIPIPLHSWRIRKRGFNQSAVIAKSLAKSLKIPFNDHVLIRHKYSRPQVELTAKLREKAVKNAFAVKVKTKVKHIALIDDVVTTTSTVNQAAKALKKSGAENVSVWGLARST